jgi:hypothetical protein
VTVRRAARAGAVLAVLAGCTPAPAGLVADLTGPVGVTLTWTAAETGPGGAVAEFATEPDGPWTILAFLPPGRHRYDHTGLMPQTTFYYRVRPVHGAASAPVRPQPRAFPEGPRLDSDPQWAEPRRAEPAPTALTVTVMSPDALLFRWADNATGEDGQLLEVRPDGATEWTVAMVLDPDVNSAGLGVLATERRAEFRVRAFTYGRSSVVVSRRTGTEHEKGNP